MTYQIYIRPQHAPCLVSISSLNSRNERNAIRTIGIVHTKKMEKMLKAKVSMVDSRIPILEQVCPSSAGCRPPVAQHHQWLL